MRSVLFCKAAPGHSYYGVKLDDPPATTTPENSASRLFAVNSASAQLSAADRQDNTEVSERSDTMNDARVTIDPRAALVASVAPTNSGCIDQDVIEKVAKFIYRGCTADLLLENIIAPIVLLNQYKCEQSTARILLAPIAVSAICMTYVQFHLIVKGARLARSGPTNNIAAAQTLQLENQMQALAGLVSAINDGIRLFFTNMVSFNPGNLYLQTTASGLIGVARFGTFLMSAAHAACDVPFGETKTGQVVYGTLTSPLMPDFLQYMMRVTPLIGAVMFSSVILTIKDTINVEDKTATAAFYMLASFSGMLGFLIQRDFICGAIQTNVKKNVASVDDWNKFWYGDSDNTNAAQMTSYAVKRFVDVVATLPLTALDASNKLLSICCYLALAILPIQIIAFAQYITYPAFAYCVFFQIFNNTQDLIKLYTGKDTSPLTPEHQQLLTLIFSIPLGLATAFTVLNLTGGKLLEGTTKAFNAKVITAPEQKDTMVNDNTALLLPEETPPQNGLTFLGRLHGVWAFTRNSAAEVVSNMMKQFRGENGMKHI